MRRLENNNIFMIFCDISSVIWREISEFYVHLKIQGFLKAAVDLMIMMMMVGRREE